MKTISVKLTIDPQKYGAAQQFMEEKGLILEEELGKDIMKFYQKYVPSPVRKYIERCSPEHHSDAVENAPGGAPGCENPSETGLSSS